MTFCHKQLCLLQQQQLLLLLLLLLIIIITNTTTNNNKIPIIIIIIIIQCITLCPGLRVPSGNIIFSLGLFLNEIIWLSAGGTYITDSSQQNYVETRIYRNSRSFRIFASAEKSTHVVIRILPRYFRSSVSHCIKSLVSIPSAFDGRILLQECL